IHSKDSTTQTIPVAKMGTKLLIIIAVICIYLKLEQVSSCPLKCKHDNDFCNYDTECCGSNLACKLEASTKVKKCKSKFIWTKRYADPALNDAEN
ncbi:unnamed protein product, partial [Candidula unifasciata]